MASDEKIDFAMKIQRGQRTRAFCAIWTKRVRLAAHQMVFVGLGKDTAMKFGIKLTSVT